MTVLLVVLAAVSADPSPKQLALLTTFRAEFIAVTPGAGKFPRSFMMGSSAGSDAERPAHKVTFDRGFHVARYEVPQNLWEAVTGSNPSKWKGPRNSVEMVSYDESLAFCNKATALMQAAELITKDQVIRLPTEAEWEYCARAGTTTAYSFGENPSALGDYAWYHGNAAGNDPPVGAKKPNAWRLYDVHGYLWEWCADVWHDDYGEAPPDGSAWKRGGDQSRRVVRGGSWKDPAEALTSSFRRSVPASFRDDAVGLRCVLAEKR